MAQATIMSRRGHRPDMQDDEDASGLYKLEERRDLGNTNSKNVIFSDLVKTI